MPPSRSSWERLSGAAGGRRDREHRAQSLSTGVNEVCRDLVEVAVTDDDGLGEERFESREILIHRGQPERDQGIHDAQPYVDAAWGGPARCDAGSEERTGTLDPRSSDGRRFVV